jgi:predicted amidohydrolase YtcJ
MRDKTFILVLVTSFCIAFAGAAQAVEYADTVYRGTIITVDDKDRTVQAVAVKGDSITAVGDWSEVKKVIGPQTKTVNLGKKVMIPGFYDAHSHFSPTRDLYKVNLNSPPIGTMTSINDIKAALSNTAPLNGWIQGTGYDDTLLADMRHPTRYDLDAVSTTIPIYITHISGHLASCNTRAFELAGIDPMNPPIVQGGLFRVENGVANGVMEEPSAMNKVNKFIPQMSPEQRLAAIEYASKVYASKGVTTANQGASVEAPPGWGYSMISDLTTALGAGKLKVRVVTWPLVQPDLLWHLDYITYYVKPYMPKTKMITIGGAKIIGDGSIQGYTGYLSKPYYVPPGSDPNYRGYPAYELATLKMLVKHAHDRGWQIFIHGNGDAEIDDILAAFDEVQNGEDNDFRNTVVHSQMAREDQLDKMEELGVIPTFYVLHTYYWGDRHRDIFMGPDRALRMSPCKSALNREIPFTIHCDTPVVPIDPLLLMWSAVNRISTSGAPIYFKNIKDDPDKIDQRISAKVALRATTYNAAYQNFEEDIKGSIEVGKLADFTILSANPLEVDKMAIRDIQVLETIVGNVSIYNAN